jgi:hypothetical protein
MCRHQIVFPRDLADAADPCRTAFVMDLSIASFDNPITRNYCVKLSFLSLYFLGVLAAISS